MNNHHDVIIVGARCAGATLAALLAKNGARVLLLEASPRGTDMPMSTHLVQPPGMDVLDALGVGDKVRKVTPATNRFRQAMDDASLVAEYQRPAYCIRRSVIDPWLQDAAEESGAELRAQHRIEDLLRDGDRITGVVARGPSGTQEIRADLVVGADGLHSTVAKLTGAPEYLVTEGSRAAYWGYFPAPESWAADWDATFEHRGTAVRSVFRCDGDLVVLGYNGPKEDVRQWGKSYREKFREALARSETTRLLSEGKEPTGNLLGLLKTRFFYRQPVGPGFALVGDAGHFKDFITGQGMADAFLDAERLSRAILDGRPEAFTRYWRERDVSTLPLHFDAVRQGEVGYNNAFMQWVIAKTASRHDIRARICMAMDRKIAPGEIVPIRTLLGFMGAALLRGRMDVLSGFMKMGRSLREEMEELQRRKDLLDEANRRLESSPQQDVRVVAPRLRA